MKITIKSSYIILYCIFLISNIILGQNFQKNIFTDIPGDNYDFDLYTRSYWGSGCYITWINKNDSIYSVYMKRISPSLGNDILVTSDSVIKMNPKIASNFYSGGMKVVWQNNIDNRYEIVMRRLINDTLDNKTIIEDSLFTNPQISISAYRMVWIENSNLYLINFYPDISDPVLIDSLDCSSPNIIKNDDITSTILLYSKEVNGNQLIYAASYDEYPDHSWLKGVFSNGQNANFGDLEGVSFETIENNVSKIKYSSSAKYFTITTNETCNYKNPYVFTYLQPITKSSLNDRTPYFVAFDTDSLENNNDEIFIKTFYLYDSLINISNMEGNDYKPQASFITINDTDYVAIFWLHEENGKINIWLAKDAFNPVYVSVKDENIEPKSFELMQNYPNPFNPKTVIKFYIKEYSKVNIEVYDILGKYIRTIMNDYKNAGTYKVVFSGDNLPSGIYFYTMSANGVTKTKSMVLLK